MLAAPTRASAAADWSSAASGVHDLLTTTGLPDVDEVDEDDEPFHYHAEEDGGAVLTLADALYAGSDDTTPEECKIVAFTLKANGPLTFEVLGHPINPDIGPLRTEDDYDTVADALHYFRQVVSHEWSNYVPMPADESQVN